ncbi:MAG: helix-turn-helix transcriptional regulator [Rhodobacteraceae bacterium]|nr:helix-turn-helix transcriptional regulator [Paracoccaceae bacterium]
MKSWRLRRHISQLDLALDAGMSQRHISFLETGRSKPSRYAVRQICEALEMPAAEHDMMLVSAGFAPQAADMSWSADVRAAVDASVDHVLEGHNPYPAVSIDRIWNLQKANESALKFFSEMGGAGQPNLLLEVMSPGELRDKIANWKEVTRALFRLLDLEVARRPHDQEGKALLQQLKSLPEVSDAIAHRPNEHPAPVVTIEFQVGDVSLRLFSLIATVGMSMDAMLDDLRIETLLPADEKTRQWFERFRTR